MPVHVLYCKDAGPSELGLLSRVSDDSSDSSLTQSLVFIIVFFDVRVSLVFSEVRVMKSYQKLISHNPITVCILRITEFTQVENDILISLNNTEKNLFEIRPKC